MATPQRLTPNDRDRALSRLRRLTTGAAVGAVFGLGGIAYVAAAVYPGHASTSSSGTSLATTGSSSATASSSTSSAASSSSSSAATAVPTASSGSASVTSGGS